MADFQTRFPNVNLENEFREVLEDELKTAYGINSNIDWAIGIF